MRVSSVFVLVVLVAVAAAQKGPTYTSRFDNVDIDGILKNDRLFNSYFKCLLDKGPCTPEGAELRKNIPEALATNCAKCTAKQRAGIEKVFRFLYEKKKPEFGQLEAKYDPKQQYRKRFAEEAKKRGIKV